MVKYNKEFHNGCGNHHLLRSNNLHSAKFKLFAWTDLNDARIVNSLDKLRLKYG